MLVVKLAKPKVAKGGVKYPKFQVTVGSHLKQESDENVFNHFDTDYRDL